MGLDGISLGSLVVIFGAAYLLLGSQGLSKLSQDIAKGIRSFKTTLQEDQPQAQTVKIDNDCDPKA